MAETDTIQEIPLTDTPEQTQSGESPDPDISLEAPPPPPPPPLVRAKSTPKARGKRGPDKKPRAKPAPRKPSPIVEPLTVESESEESVDEATMQELHALSMLRSIQNYDQNRRSRKEQLYASWFNR